MSPETFNPQSRADARWRRDKLDPSLSLEWTDQDTEKLRELTGIPEIESVEILCVLPDSALLGLRLALKETNKLDPRDFTQKMLGGDTDQIQQHKTRILNKFSFLVIDNINLKRYTKVRPFKSSNPPQSLHKDYTVEAPFPHLWHPDISPNQDMRSSPTLIADAKVYYNYALNKLFNYEFKIGLEPTPNEEWLLEFLQNNMDRVRAGKLTEDEKKRIEYIIFSLYSVDRANNIMSDISKNFVRANKAYRHKYKPSELLIINDESLVHARGEPQPGYDEKREPGVSDVIFAELE
jgi:hypothetical protein